MDNQVIIAATHDGIFHSDEVFALALLRIAASPGHVAVIRSRLAKDWDRADYVIDVGGKFDGIKWFDHHMPQGAGKRDNGVPFSSFGLIWANLGHTAVRQLLKTNIEQKLITDQDVLDVCQDLETFVAAIDAHDQAMFTAAARFSGDKTVRLELVHIQNVISSFNPVPLIEEYDDSASNRQFYAVLDWAEVFLRRFISRKASRVLSEAYVAKFDNNDNVLVLPRYCDWNGPVSKREHILFVVYPSVNGKSWTVQATKKGGGQSNTDNLRMPFPEAWAGLNEGELQKESGVVDALFCHRDRFIAAAMTMQGAITMANTTVRNKTK